LADNHVLAGILDTIPVAEPGSHPPSELLIRREGEAHTGPRPLAHRRETPHARQPGPGGLGGPNVAQHWPNRHCPRREEAQRFRAWIPLYAELHRSTLRLTEVQRTSSPLIVAQQSEAVRQLCRHQDARLDFRTMRALDRGTRVVAVATGKARRREVQTRRFVSAPHGLLPRACPPVPVPGARPGGQSVQPSATPRLTHSLTDTRPTTR
jgi:hypothetical protein